MSKKSLWSFKFNTAALVLIPAAVGINYIGKSFAEILKLPLWLDAIGTLLASMLAGPVIGGICGVVNNVIYGLTMNPISFVYAFTSLGIGITVGILAQKGWVDTLPKAVFTGLIIALVSTIISTPLNMIFWGGQTGNIWGDSLFTVLTVNNSPLFLASFLDELIVDIPDKIATVIVAYGIFKNLPKKLTVLYKNDNNIETL
ncbi:MAG: ECF transporter S component [Clostridium argentinense]|uniref:ECF transporter S component n=1 Tax=Clostridium faecium TaxID=2762223 RepID=A0ABR8YQA1_9CLOT|nr:MULTISPECIES: ECF transporter S component [Clostridium]MBD8046420.1 ECF transporter S component [Clostridium faecium]MBS5823116.1 ECF transporter S component [Clostridium argentinense]MDU1350368.1 ECF transporter S component [Clostridium argentinense]